MLRGRQLVLWHTVRSSVWQNHRETTISGTLLLDWIILVISSNPKVCMILVSLLGLGRLLGKRESLILNADFTRPESYSSDGSHGGKAIGGCFQNQITTSFCHLSNPSSQSSMSPFRPGVLQPTPKYMTHDPICLWANSQLNCLISILRL